MIESYSFGKMTIDGKLFTSDLTILPDGTVDSSWWRKSGHGLVREDLAAIVETRPEVLVVGTGDPGLLKPDLGLDVELGRDGIRMIVLPTQKAVEAFNRLKGDSSKVAACFHLTC